MSYTAKTCQEFAEALASRAPVPGGGGASALAGALGAALCSMVANYTIGKKKYAGVEEEVKAILAEAEELRERLLALIDADAEAFEPLSRAYAIPRDDPNREAVMEECLRAAAAPPMELLRLSCRAIELHRELADKGSAMVLSDVGTGAALCRSALCGAWLNVKVNTRLMADRSRARAMNAEADELAGRYRDLADQVCESVMGRYS